MDESIDTLTSTLLSRAKARDAAAWERLVDLYSPLIYHWCWRKGLSPEQAEDVGQEVFLAVTRNLATYKHETFRGWLRTITNSKIIDFRRKTGIIAPGGSDNPIHGIPAEPPSENEASEREDRQLLRLSLLDVIRSEFSEQDLRVFCRVVIDEKSPLEVAEEMQITRNQVYLAKSRILRRLRETAGEANVL